jgi:hypothetical protein
LQLVVDACERGFDRRRRQRRDDAERSIAERAVLVDGKNDPTVRRWCLRAQRRGTRRKTPSGKRGD